MGLANAVQGARHTPQRITWTDTDGTAVNLTGGTLTGRIQNVTSGATAAIDGTLTLVTAASGIFQWAYGTNDVASAGNFLVQFTATYGDSLKDISITEGWRVLPAI